MRIGSLPNDSKFPSKSAPKNTSKTSQTERTEKKAVLINKELKTEGLKGFINYNNKQTVLRSKTEDRNFLKSSQTLSQRILSKLSERHPTFPKKKKPQDSPDQLLDRIMLFRNLPTHRLGTKVYKRTSHTLSLLQSGVFFVSKSNESVQDGLTDNLRVELDEKWLVQFGITRHHLEWKYPDHQVVETFRKISDMYTPGYLPTDKSTLPGNIPDIIYNPRSRKSLFLKAVVNGSTPAHETPLKAVEEKLSLQEKNVLAILRKAVANVHTGKLTGDEERHLIMASEKIINEYDHVVRFMNSFTTLLDFANDYAAWLEDRWSGRLEKVNWIGPGTRDWGYYYQKRGITKEVKM